MRFTLITPLVIVSISSCIKQEQRPNIIYIFTDQQSGAMMSCAGNQYIKTPAMDYIANNGIRFTHAYVANPVCSPSRVSMLTGRFPGYFNDKNGNQARENKGSMDIPEVNDKVKSTSIAAYLKKAGYDLVYGGKEHLPPSLRPEVLGFRKICNDERDILAAESAKFIREKHENPYFMVVSLINPHDICYTAIRDFAFSESVKKFIERSEVECTTLDKALQMPNGVIESDFFEKYCPPLPPNFEPQIDEPKAIKYLIDLSAGLPNSDFIKMAREKYTVKEWRMYRWAYLQLTQFVDKNVQTILDAVKESGQEENTLIIFSSDHGDMNASHRMLHKSAFYEESTNIPFIAMWKGHIPAGQVNTKNLVSNGLDLLPTVCDYAGIKAQADERGRSLKPLFEGKEVEWRNTLGVEGEIGRMVVSEDGLKYVRYDAVGIEERLMDLKKDPYEKTHFTYKESYSAQLSKLRKAFEEEWFPDVK